MRSHRRRTPLEHVLVAGDLSELESVRALLALLPDTAYGQVYVELDAADELPPVASPPRVTVSRVTRAAHEQVGGPLTEAVAGWTAEWMPDEPAAERAVSLWLGGSVTEGVPTLGARLERL
jgi:NADPH-dependent ferric siderophore reductase